MTDAQCSEAMAELVDAMTLALREYSNDGSNESKYEFIAKKKAVAAAIAALEARANDPTPPMLSLLADIRYALGDNGLRMQSELVEWCKELRAGLDTAKNLVAILNRDGGQRQTEVGFEQAAKEGAERYYEVVRERDVWKAAVSEFWNFGPDPETGTDSGIVGAMGMEFTPMELAHEYPATAAAIALLEKDNERTGNND